MKSYARPLGLDPAVTFHSLCDTAAATSRERGSDIIDLQDFAGHAGDFTRTNGPITNPASAYTLTVQGNVSMSTTDTFGGGSNLTLALTGTGNQTITQSSGTMSGILAINKSGGSAKLASALSTGLACDVVEGVFDIEGSAFTCGSTFTLQDGGTLRMTGREAVTTPTVQAGSTILYDESSIATFLKDLTYSNLVIGSTGSTVFTMTMTRNTLHYTLARAFPPL